MDDRALVPYDDEPPQTLVERLTADFYTWERRGRGWQVWPYPVELEPPFRPFFFSGLESLPPIDDGRRVTLLSSLIERVRARRSTPGEVSDSAGLAEGPIWEPEPEPFAGDGSLVELQVSLPPGTKVAREAAEALLLSLSSVSTPVAFEILGFAEGTWVQFVGRGDDVPSLRQQLLAHFPEAGVTEDEGLRERWGALGRLEPVVVDFGLSHEFMLPLQTVRSLDVDPLVGVVGALDGLAEGEMGVLQILFQPVRHPWAEQALRSVADWEGGAFFVDAPHVLPLAKEKISRPLFAAAVRVGARGATAERAWEIARQVAGALRQYARPSSNELIPLSDAEYPAGAHEEDFLSRRSRRSGMLLNVAELVSLVHPPSPAVRSARLRRERRTTAEAPALAREPGLLLGENVHRGKVTAVHLPVSHRLRHVHVVGATGTGKSHLLLHLILQDIGNGEGVGVLDPHGDLVDRILERIPEARHDDVVLLDPADEAFPVAFNILSAHSELERNLLASDLVAVFRRLATSWGDQMTSVLRNAVLAFLESQGGGTLADLRRFLVEPEYRAAFLETVRDEEVVYFWRREFPLLQGRPQGPLLTRLDSFLAPKPLRRMVSQRESRVDIGEIMDGGRIFLARLAQGAIGEENAHLLGSFLAAKFQQLAAARQARPEAERRPFYLYVDEFQNFATPSMAQILGGARKYGLGLTLAHQDLAQLDLAGAGLASAALANPATRISFRVGDADARKLAEGFGPFAAADLTSLERGEAICRIERSDWSFNLVTFPLRPVAPDEAERRRSEVVERSRSRYGVPREEMEAPTVSTTPVAEESATAAPKDGEVARPKETVRRRGRGGDQHRYLQALLEKLARERGFEVAIEKAVLGGHGHVDLVLERNGLRVGCEISVSTGSRHELRNLSKCLAAGFDYAVLVSSNERTLRNTARRFVSELAPEERTRVHFLSPEAFAEWLDGVRAEAYTRSREAADPETKKKKDARQRAAPAPTAAPPTGGKEMLGTAEAAAYVRRAPQTLAKLRSIGGGPPYYKIGRNVYYDRVDLDAWLDSRRRRSTAPTEDESP